MYVTSVNFFFLEQMEWIHCKERQQIKTEDSTSVKFQLLGRQSLEINGYLSERL